jgi:anti-anti-sigma factor
MFTCTQVGERLDLAGDIRISDLEDITACLSPFLGDQQPVELNLTQIEEVDTAGLQILLAFCREKQDRGQARVTNIPQGMQKALALTGLDGHFRSFLA